MAHPSGWGSGNKGRDPLQLELGDPCVSAPEATGDTYHLVVMVTVGDVGLLEKGAEGRLWEEKPKLTLSTLPNPAASLLPRLSGTWCGPGRGYGVGDRS